MIASTSKHKPDKPSKPKRSKAKPSRPWPGYLNMETAAAYLDCGVSTAKAIMPVLAAHFGLHVHRLAGPRVSRQSLDHVLEKLRHDGLEVTVRQAQGHVEIGDKLYPIGNGRRGRKGAKR